MTRVVVPLVLLLLGACAPTDVATHRAAFDPLMGF